MIRQQELICRTQNSHPQTAKHTAVIFLRCLPDTGSRDERFKQLLRGCSNVVSSTSADITLCMCVDCIPVFVWSRGDRFYRWGWGRGRDRGRSGLVWGPVWGGGGPWASWELGTHRTTSTWSNAHWSCPAPSWRGCHHRSITPLTLASLERPWETLYGQWGLKQTSNQPDEVKHTCLPGSTV